MENSGAGRGRGEFGDRIHRRVYTEQLIKPNLTVR